MFLVESRLSSTHSLLNTREERPKADGKEQHSNSVTIALDTPTKDVDVPLLSITGMTCFSSIFVQFSYSVKPVKIIDLSLFEKFILYDVASSSGELKKPSIDDHFEQKQQDETTPVELVPQGN